MHAPACTVRSLTLVVTYPKCLIPMYPLVLMMHCKAPPMFQVGVHIETAKMEKLKCKKKKRQHPTIHSFTFLAFHLARRRLREKKWPPNTISMHFPYFRAVFTDTLGRPTQDSPTLPLFLTLFRLFSLCFVEPRAF